MSKLLISLSIMLTVILSAESSFAQKQSTEIGRFRSKQGSVKFEVVQENKRRYATMFISDNNVIDSVLFFMNRNELLELRSLIDATLKQLPADVKDDQFE